MFPKEVTSILREWLMDNLQVSGSKLLLLPLSSQTGCMRKPLDADVTMNYFFLAEGRSIGSIKIRKGSCPLSEQESSEVLFTHLSDQLNSLTFQVTVTQSGKDNTTLHRLIKMAQQSCLPFGQWLVHLLGTCVCLLVGWFHISSNLFWQVWLEKCFVPQLPTMPCQQTCIGASSIQLNCFDVAKESRGPTRPIVFHIHMFLCAAVPIMTC